MTQTSKQFFSTHTDAANYLGLGVKRIINVPRGKQVKGRLNRALTFCGKFPMSEGIEGDQWWRVDERVDERTEEPRNARFSYTWDLPRKHSKAYRAAVAWRDLSGPDLPEKPCYFRLAEHGEILQVGVQNDIDQLLGQITEISDGYAFNEDRSSLLLKELEVCLKEAIALKDWLDEAMTLQEGSDEHQESE